MNNILRCSECGAIIYSWEETFCWHDRRWVCGECFDALVGELDRIEAAMLMGCEVASGEELRN
ncbi:MAG: hypothetical protein Q4A83_01115 [Bacillota bacterium]|nr:hypothetical protein [Bacillota bacterium]